MNKLRAMLSRHAHMIVVVGILLAIFAAPVLAYPITFVTRGAAKVGTLVLGSTQVTSTGTEINVLHGVTAGTAAASKAVVLDANKALDVLRTASLRIGTSGSETAITSTGNEINTLADAPASAAMTDTPAAGSDAVQFVFKDNANTTIAHSVGLQMYTSDVSGVPSTAVTSYATLTNGKVVSTVAGAVALTWTTSGGLLGVTVTAGAGTYHVSFVLPDGKIWTSPTITSN